MLKPEELTPEIKLRACGPGRWVDECRGDGTRLHDRLFEQTYKTVDFVTEQCKKLAEQIAKDDAKKFERLKIEEV